MFPKFQHTMDRHPVIESHLSTYKQEEGFYKFKMGKEVFFKNMTLVKVLRIILK